MKKMKLISLIVVLPRALAAQSGNTMHLDNDILKIGIAVVATGVVMLFLLEIIKRFLDYRLKDKALELRISDELASKIFSDKTEKNFAGAAKWTFLITGLGIGFTCVHYTLPIGFHSLAIIAFSIAGGFLAYFLYIKRSEK